MPRIFLLTVFFLLAAFTAVSFAGESSESSGKQTFITPKKTPGEETPLVVIYTLSSCPHCMEAKEYFNNNNIPFINREVDTDDANLATLLSIYDSMGVPEEKRGVPLLVIGNRIMIQGFNREKVQNALKEVTSKPK